MTNENGNTTHQNLWDASEVGVQEVYSNKCKYQENTSQIDKLTLYLKKL